MNSPDFKWKHYQPEIILLCTRWYLQYRLSYRDLVEMMNERGLCLAHTTIMRWVHSYAPEIDKRIRPKLRKSGDSWKVDETYVKVKGQWVYLYRAVDKNGDTIDFYLSETRDQIAAARFLKKALTSEHTSLPRVINVDKARSYPTAVNMAKQAGYLPECMVLRQVKYLNNRIEADHFPIKELIRPGLGFGSFEGAIRTIRGYESLRMVKKGQIIAIGHSAADRASFINSLFGIAA
jgi:transposase, IS6 family